MGDTSCMRLGTLPWTPTDVVIASFDPAIKNLAVRIERRRSGAPIEALVFDKWELPDDTIYPSLCERMESIQPFLELCHVAVVERQNPISKGFQVHTNSKVMRVFGFLTGWLCARFPSLTVYDISPKVKGKVLNAPSKLTYAQTKSWSVTTAKTLLETCGDTESLTLLTKRGTGKKDDLADVVVQTEAFLRIQGSR
jgi:hypothetical protein